MVSADQPGRLEQSQRKALLSGWSLVRVKPDDHCGWRWQGGVDQARHLLLTASLRGNHVQACMEYVYGVSSLQMVNMHSGDEEVSARMRECFVDIVSTAGVNSDLHTLR